MITIYFFSKVTSTNLSEIMKNKTTLLIPTQFANQQIYNILRQDIVRCEIKPGTLLSEKEVSERFQVSRQPVRDAFIKLAENGLIQIRPQRGSYVCKISLSRVKELSFVRQTIESEITRSATLLATAQQIGELEENLARQKSCIPQANMPEFFNIDDDFHKLLSEIAQCSLAWEIIDSNKATVDRVRHLLLSSITPPEILVTQHATIVEMIKGKNSEEAASAMKKHLNEINESVRRIYQTHQHWFLDDL